MMLSKPNRIPVIFIAVNRNVSSLIKKFCVRFFTPVSCITKAKKKLGWFPTYNIKNSVKITTEWYLKVFKKRKNPFDVTNEQIKNYMNENNWT